MFDDILFCCISKWNWSDEYLIRGRIQKCGEGGNGAWVFGAVGAGARERKDTWSRGSREGVGAGAREKIDAVRNMSMKRRRD